MSFPPPPKARCFLNPPPPRSRAKERRFRKHRRRKKKGLTRAERRALIELMKVQHAPFAEAVWKDSEGQFIVPGDIHRIIWNFLDRCAEAKQPCLILAPRGIGKTESGLAFLMRRLAIHPTKRFQIVSDTSDNAQDRLGSIRQYLEKDPDFRYYFPAVQLDRSKRGRRTLSKLRVIQNKYAKDPSVEACGAFGGATGHRADEQFYDDLCSERNSVLAPADRARLKKLFFKTWTPILVPGGFWYYIGTLYHEDDLTHALLANKRVATLKIGLSEDFDHYDAEEWWPGGDLDPEGKPTNPKRFTIPLWVEGGWDEERYRKRYDEMLASGDASAFMSQYRNILIDPETAAFRPEWFTISDEQRKTFSERPLSYYTFRTLYADLAFSKNKEACFYAGVVMGWDPKLAKAVVLHAWRVKESLGKRVERFLDAVEEFDVTDVAIEGQHDGSFGERIEERAIERNIGFRLKRVTHGREEKENRISSLGPLIEGSKILVDGARWRFFRGEALVFPQGKKDGLDALEGAWSRVKLWLKRRGGMPGLLPVAGQIDRDSLSRRKARYHFGPVAQQKKALTTKSLAEQFFR